MAYLSLRVAHGFYCHRRAGIRLDPVLAPGLSPAGRGRERLGGRTGLHSQRPSGPESDRGNDGSLADLAYPPASLGDRSGQILYRSDLVGLSVLDAGFLE